MAGGFWGTVRRLALPLIGAAFALGLLVGLVLGWRVWPVKWYDTDPADLRLQHQVTYLIMTADSLAVNGNAQLARQRLLELTDEDTSWTKVAKLVESVALEREQAGDAAQALRLRRMAQAVGMPQPNVTPVTTAQKGGRSSTARWVQFFVALAILLAVMALITWFVTRQLRLRSAGQRVAVMAAQAPPLASEPERPSARWSLRALAQRVFARKPRVVQDAYEEEEEYEEEELDEEEEEEAATQEPWEYKPGPIATAVLRRPTPAATPLAPRAAAAEPEEVEEEVSLEEEAEEEVEEVEPIRPALRVAPPPVRPVPSPVTAGGGKPLGAFEAEYSLGDDDFDCSYSIESADGDFLGECGIGIADVLKVDGAQQVDAFEVWLFDKGDIRTVSKILVSEYTYGDQALVARLRAKGEVAVAQPGMDFTLETLSLRVIVTIKECSYAPDSIPPESVFERLAIELVTEKSTAA